MLHCAPVGHTVPSGPRAAGRRVEPAFKQILAAHRLVGAGLAHFTFVKRSAIVAYWTVHLSRPLFALIRPAQLAPALAADQHTAVANI